jgi:hypothetical protein
MPEDPTVGKVMMMLFYDLEYLDMSSNAMVAEKRLQNLRWGQYINPKRCRHLPTILQGTKSQHHQRARNFDLTKYPQKFCARK